MSRKQKLSRAERDRRRARREEEEIDEAVKETVEKLSCSVETALELVHQCDSRLVDVDIELAFTSLAHEVWAGRAGQGEQLAPLLVELTAELARHARAIESLALRIHPFIHGAHEHLDPGVVDPAHVRRVTFPPREELRKAVGGQIPTDSGGH